MQSVSVISGNRNCRITCIFWSKTLKSLCAGLWKHKLFEDLVYLSEKFGPEMGESVTFLKQLDQEDVENRLRHFGKILKKYLSKSH